MDCKMTDIIAIISSIIAIGYSIYSIIKTYVLYTISTEKHEPKEPAIHYGTFQHNDNAEPVRPCFTDRSKHGNAKSDSLVIYYEIYYDKKTRYADL